MFNLSNIQNAAAKLGIDLQFNSDNPGFHFVKSNGEVDVFTFDKLQESLINEFSVNKNKNDLKYDLKYNFKPIREFTLDIHAGDTSDTHIIVDEISLNVSGHNSTTSRKREFNSQLGGLNSKGNYNYSYPEAV